MSPLRRFILPKSRYDGMLFSTCAGVKAESSHAGSVPASRPVKMLKPSRISAICQTVVAGEKTVCSAAEQLQPFYDNRHGQRHAHSHQ